MVDDIVEVVAGRLDDEELARMLVPPESKHKMSMHADTEERKPLSQR